MSQGVNQKKAVITGITGQDGYYLTQFLCQQGYQVFGFARNPRVTLEGVTGMIYGDLAVSADVELLIQTVQPDEIYHLASQSRPSLSWTNLTETLRVNGEGAVNVFEAARRCCPTAKIYQASSSEMFGNGDPVPQHEAPLQTTDPYAAAKLFAHQMAGIYRQRYGLFIACGILFNHESERRPLHFVTQKIAHGAACAALGITESPELNEIGQPMVQAGQLVLGDLSVSRDWGCAQDYVKAMWLMLQQTETTTICDRHR